MRSRAVPCAPGTGVVVVAVETAAGSPLGEGPGCGDVHGDRFVRMIFTTIHIGRGGKMHQNRRVDPVQMRVHSAVPP